MLCGINVSIQVETIKSSQSLENDNFLLRERTENCVNLSCEVYFRNLSGLGEYGQARGSYQLKLESDIIGRRAIISTEITNCTQEGSQKKGI